MNTFDFEDARKFAELLETMTETEREEYLNNQLILESDLHGEDPTIFEIDKPIDEWVRENNCHYLDEWLERMRNI